MGKVSAELFSLTGDQYLGREYKNNNFDCQDFVEQVMHRLGIPDNLPGSNAWYRKMTWVGTPRECIMKFGSIPKGALLFILQNDGKEPEKYRSDGIGNASHIGIKTGSSGADMVKRASEYGVADAARYNFGDGAIHSSSSRGHVVTSKFADREISGGWNRIGLWDRFDYGERINKLLTGKSESEKEGVSIVVEEEAKVIGGSLNLRASASTDARKIISIPNGCTVTVIEKTNDEWWKVKFNSYTGYVRNEYLAVQTAVEIKLPRDTAEALYNALRDALGK